MKVCHLKAVVLFFSVLLRAQAWESSMEKIGRLAKSGELAEMDDDTFAQRPEMPGENDDNDNKESLLVVGQKVVIDVEKRPDGSRSAWLVDSSNGQNDKTVKNNEIDTESNDDNEKSEGNTAQQQNDRTDKENNDPEIVPVLGPVQTGVAETTLMTSVASTVRPYSWIFIVGCFAGGFGGILGFALVFLVFWRGRRHWNDGLRGPRLLMNTFMDVFIFAFMVRCTKSRNAYPAPAAV